MQIVPKVSYIIAAYNAEKFIGDCIRSILKQEWMNFEIIVSDDGSTDETIAAAEAFNHPAIRILKGVNAGQCKATNRALSICSGDYIQYIDADDLLAPGKIKAQMEVQQKFGPTFITFSKWASFYKNPADQRDEDNPAYMTTGPVEWLINLYSAGGMLANSCYLISKQLINKCGLYDERLSRNNDLEYFSRTVLGSEGMVFCENALALYRRNVHNNLSSMLGYQALLSEFEAKNMAVKCLLSRNNSLEAKRACANLYADIANQTFKIYPEISTKAFSGLNEIGIPRPILPGSSIAMRILINVLGFKKALQFRAFIT